MAIGPSGWTRTTTSRVKGPECCVDTTEGLERMTGFEPVPQGLEGPWATVTPHSLWFGLWHRPTRPSKLATWDASSTPRPNMDRCRSPAHRQPSVVKDPALSSWWAARDSNPIAPSGERGYGPSADHPLRTAHLATAPGFEPGPASFGGSDASVTPRCPRHLTSRPSRRHNLPVAWPVFPHGLETKTKKAF